MSRRGWFIAGLVVLSAVVLGLVGRGRTAEGPPFDPRSVGSSGTAALVEVLRELGADVTVSDGPPSADSDVAIILVEGHGDGARAAIEDWVQAGGRLILGDPASPLNPFPVADHVPFDLFGPVPLTVGCDHPAMSAVDRVASSGWTSFEPGGDPTIACLHTDGGPALVGTPSGEGEIVVFGGRRAWTNGALDRHDNAVLAAALVQPDSTPRLHVLAPPTPGSGERSLTDLVPPRVRSALLQMGVAFAILAWARSRRHGGPVREELPTRIRGSEMVAAVGGLLQRAGQRTTTARALQDHLARHLERTFAVPAGTPREVLVDLVAARTDVPEDQLWTALRPREVADDRELTALAGAVAEVRERISRGDRGGGPVPVRSVDEENRR